MNAKVGEVLAGFWGVLTEIWAWVAMFQPLHPAFRRLLHAYRTARFCRLSKVAELEDAATEKWKHGRRAHQPGEEPDPLDVSILRPRSAETKLVATTCVP